MIIDYPPGFPESAKAAVEQAIAVAEEEFLIPSGISAFDEHRAPAYFALKVFEAFFWRARDVATTEEWTATRLRDAPRPSSRDRWT